MRLLIDGYNLMYAVVSPSSIRKPDGLRRARHRFLNELGSLLGPYEGALTTVVFDASAGAPAHLPKVTHHKGMTVVFAHGDDDADSRLEELIAKHSAPKSLTVVSTDLRVRQAAQRKRARPVTADDFWSQLKSRHAPPQAPSTSPPARTPEERDRLEGPTPEEAAFWNEVFSDVLQSKEACEVFEQSETLLTDEDIRRIEDEVRRER